MTHKIFLLQAVPKKDVVLPKEIPPLLVDMHANYIISYSADKDDYTYVMTEYLRMSGVYWGLTALDLVGRLEDMDKAEIFDFIKQCQHECGGIGPSIKHDPHLLYTLSAIQILSMYNALDVIDTEKVVKYVKERQQPDGSFVEKAVEFVESCMNFDGGFGSKPGSESHAGLIYCCLGFLSITGRLDLVDVDRLGWWLCERQLPSGGLNGRPEKLPDVCYSWWVLSSLTILGRLHWIDKNKLVEFILACQDTETGGFSDRPGDMVDPFHTLFGLGAISLLEADPRVKPINPVFCMPEYVIERMGVKATILLR
ncbi:hypothetical protein G9C98_000138 [Cotesia typhae]|uniref:Geranylgeranyl transferase type-2 subunit beta n=1 Tax=Cotesia typhae TaxID=2053667 RepID=A0A8J5R558_9HYME|nr:hypothetical protein G9C98_000138 [Cotesia typhae]